MSISPKNYIQSIVPWEISRDVTNGLSARIRMNPPNRPTKLLSSFFNSLAGKHRESCCLDHMIRVLRKYFQKIAIMNGGKHPAAFEEPILKIVGRVCELARIAKLGRVH